MPTDYIYGATIKGTDYDLQDSDARAMIEGLQTVTDAITIYPTASGAIASFPDGADGVPVKELVAQIDPVQDLHGYNMPWVGGVKNKLDVSGFSSRTHNGLNFVNNGNGTISVSGTATQNTFLEIATVQTAGSYVLNGCPANGGSSSYRLDVRRDGAVIDSGTDNGSGSSIVELSAGDKVYIRINNNYAISGSLLFKPMLRLSTVTDATFEPYSNICPITGWTGANVERAGKNLLDQTGLNWQQNKNITEIGEEGTIQGAAYNKTFINVNPNTAYTWQGFLGTDAITSIVVSYYDKTGNFVGRNIPLSANSFVRGSVNSGTFTTPANCYKLRICLPYPFDDSLSSDNMIEVGSTATTYEPYARAIYPISFDSAGTVYGGSLNVTTGVLTVDRGGFSISASDDLTVDTITQLNANTTRIATIRRTPSFPESNAYAFGNTDGLYSHGIYLEAWSDTRYHGYMSGVGANIYIPSSNGVTDATSAIAWLKAQASAGTPIQFEYILNTPVTYQLTPTEVKTLLANNNIRSDTGDVSVNYPADPKLYIDGKIAEIVAQIVNA